jgi:CRP-like cAMP-binding protein
MEHQQQFLMALISETFSKDEYIVREGEQGDRFYVITHGELVITKKRDDSESEESIITHLYEVGLGLKNCNSTNRIQLEVGPRLGFTVD